MKRYLFIGLVLLSFSFFQLGESEVFASSWSEEHNTAGTDIDFFDVSTHGWTVGHDFTNVRGTIYKYNGSSWTEEHNTGGTDIGFFGISMLDQIHGWVVGRDDSNNRGTIYKYNGSSWSEEYNTGGTFIGLEDISMLDQIHGWAVGYDWDNNCGAICKYDGTNWLLDHYTFPADIKFYGVYMVNVTHGWAVGYDDDNNRGTIYKYNGSSWTEEYNTGGTDNDFYRVSMVDATCGWVIGNEWIDAFTTRGYIYKYDGSSWTQEYNTGGTNMAFYGVSMVDASQGWVVGYDDDNNRGTIYKYNGSSWSEEYNTGGTDIGFGGVSMLDANHGWVAGRDLDHSRGTIYKYDSTTWYLAEGCTDGFDEWVLIQNPNSNPAICEITFMDKDGNTEVLNETIPATSRRTYYVNTYMPGKSVSTKVESTNGVGIIVERAMYWDVNGMHWAGGHCSCGITSPALTWYLAEGATLGTFDEWVLIQNPNSQTASVKVTFMTSDGTTVVRNINVPGTSRYTIHVDDVPGLSDTSVSTRVESTNGVGIIAERAMYWDVNGMHWVGGHNSCGVTSTATTWYLAEGCTDGFDEWVLIQNPNSNPAICEITFMDKDGNTEVLNETIPATSRRTYYVNTYMPGKSVSTKVESTNGVGIIAERAMYWDVDGMHWAGGHCSCGVTSTALTWYLAEGCTDDFDEYVLIQNPNSSTANVTVTFMTGDGTTVERKINVPETSRYTIHVNDVLPNESVSTKVESTNGIGIIAERAMYWDVDGHHWMGGHCSKGIAE